MHVSIQHTLLRYFQVTETGLVLLSVCVSALYAYQWEEKRSPLGELRHNCLCYSFYIDWESWLLKYVFPSSFPHFYHCLCCEYINMQKQTNEYVWIVYYVEVNIELNFYRTEHMLGKSQNFSSKSENPPLHSAEQG